MTAPDGMAVEVVERLPAHPDRVWALLTDVERMAGLGPENVRTTWDGPERGLGARFRGVNRREGIGTWEVGCTVVAWDPPHCFGWVTGDPGRPSARWTYWLSPDDDGGTLVRQRFEHGPGPTYLRDAVEARPDRADRYVAGRAAELERNMRLTLSAAAALLA